MTIKLECGYESNCFADRELGQHIQTFLKESVKFQVERLEQRYHYCRTHLANGKLPALAICTTA